MEFIGIDVGSQTIKLVVTDEDGSVLHSVYRRHNSDIRQKLREVIEEYLQRYGNASGYAAVTGSGGIAIAKMLGLPFVQEVMATTYAVRTAYPDADAVIELGGEDAKIVFLDDIVEQRMNTSCAGGTGSCIDSVGALLGETLHTLNLYAGRSRQVYPLASRCAVFEQAGVRKLLGLGVAKEDIAASAFDAVVRQTIGGLACGHPIRGKVVFLGGPFQYFSNLYARFCEVLGLNEETGIRPEKAHLFTARGAALAAKLLAEEAEASDISEAGNFVSITGLGQLAAANDLDEEDFGVLEPLFENDVDRKAFKERHSNIEIPRVASSDVRGPLYVGIDAGAAAVKGAAVDQHGRLCATISRETAGDALSATADVLEGLYAMLPSPTLAPVAYTVVTGSDDDAIMAIMGAEDTVVDTVAHAKAALWCDPDASVVIDGGGQDMKVMSLSGNDLESLRLNDPCSSGCGLFLSGMSEFLGMSPSAFDEEASKAQSPVDLDTKCIVFMNSRLRHAQKVGASRSDMAAGLAYAIARNVKRTFVNEGELEGDDGHILVQGGLFEYDAVLRACEKLLGTTVKRVEGSRYMGAIGAALVARERASTCDGDQQSTLIKPEELESFDPIYSTFACTGCDKECSISVISYGDYQIFISGNACARGAEIVREAALELGEHDVLGSSSMIPRSRGSRRQRHVSEIGNGIVIPGYLRSFSGGMVGGGGSQGIADEPRRVDYYATQLERDRTRERKIKIIAPTRFLSAEDVARKQQEESRAEQIRQEEAARAAKQREKEGRLRVTYAPHSVPTESSDSPDTISVEHELLAAYGDTRGDGRRGDIVIGLPDVLDAYGFKPFWHSFLTSLGYGVFVPDEDRAEAFAAISGESVPSESLCDPARIAFRRVYEMLDRGAQGILMPMAASQKACPVERGIAGVVAGNVPQLLSGERVAVQPALSANPFEWFRSPQSLEALQTAFAALGDDGLPTIEEIAVAVDAGLAAQRDFERTLGDSLDDVAKWLDDDPVRRAFVLSARIYHCDPMLLHSLNERIMSLGFAVIGSRAIQAARTSEASTADAILELSPGRSIRDAVAYVEEHPQTSTVFVQALNCAPDGAAIEMARTGLPGRSATVVLDEAFDNRHIDTILRTLAESSDEPAHSERLTALPQDLCSTMRYLFQKAEEMLKGDETLTEISLPVTCTGCVELALEGMLARRFGRPISVHWQPMDASNQAATISDGEQPTSNSARVRLGIVGNPLLCFDSELNDGIVHLIESLGAQPVLPNLALISGEDARYEDQIRVFANEGVDAILYLQNFNCLKGYVDGAGALQSHRLEFPSIPITVLDVDPDSSLLNRENRIRLVIESAKVRKSRG